MLNVLVLMTIFVQFIFEEHSIANPKTHQKNNLANEASPYLQQHKNNPIWWQPWSSKALELAKRHNKPIFLSIGYATCHWCHVMEGDSFEKKSIADRLNENFISIKVDREERPDIDAIYMRAVQAMTGSGGWPLTLILLPDGKPFFGATFLERRQLEQLLDKVVSAWNSKEKKELIKAGAGVQAHLEKSFSFSISNLKSQTISEEVLSAFFEHTKKVFDEDNGGFGTSPKFPLAMNLMTLLRIHKRSNSPDALAMVVKTLEKMAAGGIHDQLAGGFHRYSTDNEWLVPHFEKMLYDNALLAMAYIEAYQITNETFYKSVAERTLNYIHAQMTSPDGGFYAAEDADSEKTEGKYYVWKFHELEKLLTEAELRFAERYFGVTKKGNFSTEKFSEIETSAGMKGIEGANILYRRQSKQFTSKERQLITPLISKLLSVRSKRIPPLKDRTIITSWNGLMLGSFSKAARVFDNKKYLEIARKGAAFIINRLTQKGILYRSIVGSTLGHRANLSDYSNAIYGLIHLYQSDFDRQWLKFAQNLQNKQIALFWDYQKSVFFDTDGQDKTLLLRTSNIFDNSIPSGNSVAALNLQMLYKITHNEKFYSIAKEILTNSSEQVAQAPDRFPMLLQAYDYYLDRDKEVVVIQGSNFQPKLLNPIASNFFPNMVIALGQEHETYPSILLNKRPIKGKTTFYVCENKTCKLPTTKVEVALKQIGEHRVLAIDTQSKGP